MRALVIPLVAAAVTFAAAEAVCRLLLKLPDHTVPLAALPLTLLVWGLATAKLRGRESPTQDPE